MVDELTACRKYCSSTERVPNKHNFFDVNILSKYFIKESFVNLVKKLFEFPHSRSETMVPSVIKKLMDFLDIMKVRQEINTNLVVAMFDSYYDISAA
jgi:hypothetical protein